MQECYVQGLHWRLDHLELLQHLQLPEQQGGLSGMLCARLAGFRCVKTLCVASSVLQLGGPGLHNVRATTDSHTQTKHRQRHHQIKIKRIASSADWDCLDGFGDAPLINLFEEFPLLRSRLRLEPAGRNAPLLLGLLCRPPQGY